MAAGLSIGFSLMASGLIRPHLADTNWRPLLASVERDAGPLSNPGADWKYHRRCLLVAFFNHAQVVTETRAR
jgi:hypothetical protein